jgi:hypothetical protein
MIQSNAATSLTLFGVNDTSPIAARLSTNFTGVGFYNALYQGNSSFPINVSVDNVFYDGANGTIVNATFSRMSSSVIGLSQVFNLPSGWWIFLDPLEVYSRYSSQGSRRTLQSVVEPFTNKCFLEHFDSVAYCVKALLGCLPNGGPSNSSCTADYFACWTQVKIQLLSCLPQATSFNQP